MSNTENMEEIPKEEETKMESSDEEVENTKKDESEDERVENGKSEVEKIEAKKDEKDMEEDEESFDEEDAQPGLFEQPLVLEEGAKRQRKKVDRIEVSAASSNVDKAPTIKEGRGARLGEIPYVEAQLNKVVGAELKPLHKLLFGRIGAVTEVKRNIKRFNGYEFEKDSADYQKKLAILKASTLAGLKGLSQTLGLERSGTKDVLMERIMEFLLKPKDFGKSVPGSKKRKSSGKSKAVKSEKPKGKKTPSKKSKKSSDDEDEESNEEESDVEEEEEKSSSESEVEEAPQKKKARKSSPKKEPAKKAKAPAAKAKKASPKKSPKKATSPKKKSTVSTDDSDDYSSEDEAPLAVKKPRPPSDDDLKEAIKKILDGANLEEITMKTVCRTVYDKYPDFDLTGRKDFIKSTVKQMIR